MSIKVSSEALRKMKEVIDYAGVLNEANRYVMETLDIQPKNIFEIIFTPATMSIDPVVIAQSAMDTVITRLHLQSIDIDFNSLEFESADIVKYVSSITRPESCILHFIENELGIVRNYIQLWKNSIYTYVPLFGYRFKDDQEACKKNAIVMPLMGSSIPSTAWVKLEGLKIKSQEAITFGHAEAEPLIISVVCSVDKVDWMTPTNLFI